MFLALSCIEKAAAGLPHSTVECGNGTGTNRFVFERFAGGFSGLQKTGRERDGGVSRYGFDCGVGSAIEFDRDHRETSARKYALAVDGFFDQRWREADTQSRWRV